MKPTILALLVVAALVTAGPAQAQSGTRPEQSSNAAQPTRPEQQSNAAEAGPPDMAAFVARVRKGMKGGKGSAQARKARVRQIAREHAERGRQQAAEARQR